MITVGLTGGFGMGKSTASRMFEGLGAVCVDADSLGHEALEQDKDIQKSVRERFGEEVVGKGKKIDRKALAGRVFTLEEDREWLNALIHPYVLRRLGEELYAVRAKKENAIVVVELPLLVEAGLTAMFDYIVVVKASAEEQRARCKKKWKISDAAFEDRLRAQLPIEKKLRVADFVIDNTFDLDQTHEQVKTIWETIMDEVNPDFALDHG